MNAEMYKKCLLESFLHHKEILDGQQQVFQQYVHDIFRWPPQITENIKKRYFLRYYY